MTEQEDLYPTHEHAGDDRSSVESLDPEQAPEPIGVYERPQRLSPLMVALIIIALLLAAYFAYQLIF